MAYTPTYEELETIRTWVGQGPLDDEIYVMFDRLEGDIDATILETLRRMLAEAREDPSQISLPSGLSLSFQESIRSLERTIKEFEDRGGTDGLSDVSEFSVYQLVRDDYR